MTRATSALWQGASAVRVDAESPEAEYGRFLLASRPDVMGPRLAEVLGGNPHAWHVLDAKFEPGIRATVLYAQGCHLVRGDVATATSPAGAGPAVAMVAPGVLLHSFPHDPDLPQLAELMSGTLRVGPTAAPLGSGHPAESARTALLRYRPGKRATVLLRQGGRRVVAKAYHDTAKAGAVAAEAPVLAAVAQQSSGRLRLAATLGHDAERAIVVQETVPGRPLDAMLLTRSLAPAPDAESHVRLAARALAAFHAAAGAASLRRRDGDRELRRFQLRARGIRSVEPVVGEAAAMLAERLVAVQHRVPSARIGLVHGDCKPSQFLLDGANAYLLDLDHVGEADQASDLGTFVASLRQLAVRRSPVGAAARDTPLLMLGDVFVDAYLRCAPRQMDGDMRRAMRARIRWHEAVALERKALRAFARAPRSPLAVALIREAHRCLDDLEAP